MSLHNNENAPIMMDEINFHDIGSLDEKIKAFYIILEKNKLCFYVSDMHELNSNKNKINVTDRLPIAKAEMPRRYRFGKRRKGKFVIKEYDETGEEIDKITAQNSFHDQIDVKHEYFNQRDFEIRNKDNSVCSGCSFYLNYENPARYFIHDRNLDKSYRGYIPRIIIKKNNTMMHMLHMSRLTGIESIKNMIMYHKISSESDSRNKYSPQFVIKEKGTYVLKHDKIGEEIGCTVNPIVLKDQEVFESSSLGFFKRDKNVYALFVNNDKDHDNYMNYKLAMAMAVLRIFSSQS